MILFKDGVDASNVHPAIWTALGVAYILHRSYAKDMVITAMNAGTSGHMVGSYHYPTATPSGMCQAVDLRTDDIPVEIRSRWAGNVKDLLNPLGFDVILESPETTQKPPHLHIEYQPHQAQTDWMFYLTKKDNGDYNVPKPAEPIPNTAPAPFGTVKS